MKKVLVIAYHFPPGGGPGVQRVLKHVTYLREAGWQPIVLTVENGDFPARDESLLSKVPSDVTVVRVPILEPYSLYRRFMGGKGAAIDVNVNKSGAQRSGWKERLAEFVRATFFIPDARVAWMLTAVTKAVDLVREHEISAIYSSSPPYTCALIARSVKRRTGLPWVAGFRDPWTQFLTTPDRWFLPAMIDRSLERSAFEEADAVECAWTGIIDDARRKYPHLPAEKFHHVPNGYDASDFPNVSYAPNRKFTITYTGSMYGRRTPREFLRALDLLKQRGVIRPEDVHLRFVGRFGAEVHAMLDASSFGASIERISYVTHQESVGFLMRSEASLLIVDDAKESAEIVPGKVYEYLGVGRPVIAIAPRDSAIERLLRETDAGRSASQEDIEGVASIIEAYFTRWQRGEQILTPNASEILKYERRAAAHQLAHILHTLTP
ncbi:MAG: glycosyltransferase family 4 protein [Candidatus Kapabacteria bacterium]|nr:glycosyltransferase family 4 protein [Candidatus Kapabacteria bacterium]